jgi:8-oxo-dGTP pyrophosphatase MutT (NUDIX family)
MLTAEALRWRAAHALHAEPSKEVFDPTRIINRARSDFDLDGGRDAGALAHSPARQAAVLFPIVMHEQPTVLLTERSADLPSHAGQVAFPGGKVEPHDHDELETALRETREEIGLDQSWIEPLGYLDNYRTGTNFNIVPVVALVTPGFTLEIDTREVAAVFEVPLDFLLDPANHELHQREWRGRMRTYYAMPYERHYIWGATAGMIRNFHERMQAE